MHRRTLKVLVVVGLMAGLAALSSTVVFGMASHAGWPEINGMLLLNAGNESRPLDGRPGQDPFDGTDPNYSCNGIANFTRCLRGGPEPWRFGPPSGPHLKCHGEEDTCWRKVVPEGIGHNELLGGNGNDTIHAGPAGDVVWGDYKPSGQPESQADHMYGGAGSDWIYASHGSNYIWTGAGNDHVALVYGHGTVTCNGSGHKTLVVLYLAANRRYKLVGCGGATIERFRGPE